MINIEYIDTYNDEFIDKLNKDSVLIIDKEEKIPAGQALRAKLDKVGCKVFIISHEELPGEDLPMRESKEKLTEETFSISDEEGLKDIEVRQAFHRVFR